ncbi:MAG: cytochrome c biogenesis protein CcsA [Cyclobacteriaceae bacterium]
MHYLIGNLGHLFVIVAFVSALVSFIAFFLATQKKDLNWVPVGSWAFYLHAFATVGILLALFLIINRHYFEYHYAWNYSSKFLPIYYQVSSFWNGQEGSFLLWMFWNVILGVILLNTNRYWKPSIMAIMSLSQLFLASMVMGVVLLNYKMGSSPFMLLRDVIQDNIFKLDPEFVPADGNGLNPLLQNYWMVIHPPTLFLGFAATIVPFTYAIAGLWIKDYKGWIRPALPWAQFAALVLGVGILMGAYWAYETLNFGGYWNWDPVENAIYVPWLTLVAAIHTMIAYKKNPTALKSSIILSVVTFLLILYSTFLTRSGVLGETSVHSFTDLGLSGQLLLYLLLFLLGTTALIISRWKDLPKSTEETTAYSREFWIFIGATTLCLMAFQVIMPTSIPVWNEIVELFGGSSNMAPPADQVVYYSKFQLWFAIVIALLSGLGQFFWWGKMDKSKLKEELRTPIIISLLLSSAIFLLSKLDDIGYMLLLTSSSFSLVANTSIMIKLKGNIKLSGGSITHIGIAMMLIGILFSSGYSKILSKNNTGLVWSQEFPDEVNQNNLLLFLNEPRQMGDYSMVYKGMRKKTKELGFVNNQILVPTDDPLKLQLTEDIENFKKGDLLTVTNNENTYFEVVYTKQSGKSFTLFPRVQLNEQMGTVYSPDINRTLTADLYTHVRTFPDPEQEARWSETEEIKVQIGETFHVNDYVATFKGMERINEIDDILLSNPQDVAVKAIVEIQGEYDNYTAEPVYIIKDQMAGRIADEVTDLGVKLTVLSIQPEENSFTLGLNTTQKDWIIMEAVEKPWINVLWIGTLLLCIGFIIAITRRYEEFVKMRDKDME